MHPRNKFSTLSWFTDIFELSFEESVTAKSDPSQLLLAEPKMIWHVVLQILENIDPEHS